MSGWARKTTASIFDNSGGVPLGYEADAAKVWLAGGTAGASIQVAINATCKAASLTLSTASAGSKVGTVRSAAGAGTTTQVRGFSLWNRSTLSRVKWRLTVGTKLVAVGGLAPQAAYNWNKVGAYQQKINSSILLMVQGIDGGTTVICSVDFKES